MELNTAGVCVRLSRRARPAARENWRRGVLAASVLNLVESWPTSERSCIPS